MKRSPSLSALALCGFACSLFGTVHAQIIIHDLFDQAPNGGITSLSGKAPNTNLPEGAWAVQGFGFTAEQAANSFLGSQYLTGAPGTPVPYGTVNGDAATLSLAGYNSGTLTLSVYMSDTAGGDASLGFSNVAIGTPGLSFSGLNITNAGALSLTNAGVTSSAVAFGGTFSASTLSLLSFTIDTATGNITAISFQNSTADYSSLLTFGAGAFTSSQTAFLELKASTTGQYADLTLQSSVVAVPEPSTWAMISGGLAMVCFYQRRRWS